MQFDDFSVNANTYFIDTLQIDCNKLRVTYK